MIPPMKMEIINYCRYQLGNFRLMYSSRFGYRGQERISYDLELVDVKVEKLPDNIFAVNNMLFDHVTDHSCDEFYYHSDKSIRFFDNVLMHDMLNGISEDVTKYITSANKFSSTNSDDDITKAYINNVMKKDLPVIVKSRITISSKISDALERVADDEFIDKETKERVIGFILDFIVCHELGHIFFKFEVEEETEIRCNEFASMIVMRTYENTDNILMQLRAIDFGDEEVNAMMYKISDECKGYANYASFTFTKFCYQDVLMDVLRNMDKDKDKELLANTIDYLDFLNLNEYSEFIDRIILFKKCNRFYLKQ